MRREILLYEIQLFIFANGTVVWKIITNAVTGQVGNQYKKKSQHSIGAKLDFM